MYVGYSDASYHGKDECHTNIGFIILHKDKKICRVSKEIMAQSSMEAEYIAICELIKKAIELKIPKIEIKTDCKGIVDQLAGRAKVRRNLMKQHQMLSELMELHKHTKIVWIPRKQNKETDKLIRNGNVNEARNIKYKWNRRKIYRKVLFLVCPSCKEIKSISEFPDIKNPDNKKKKCYHCLQVHAERIC